MLDNFPVDSGRPYPKRRKRHWVGQAGSIRREGTVAQVGTLYFACLDATFVKKGEKIIEPEQNFCSAKKMRTTVYPAR